MNGLIILSIGLNLIVFLAIIYLAINGRKHVQDFFVERIIDVRYAQKVSMFRSCPPSKGAIVFLGDSITEGGQWSELFESSNILNRGIGGDITAGVLARIDEVVRHEPSRVFLCIGTNDLARGIKMEDTMTSYRAVIRAIQEGSPKTRIYIQSVLPVGPKVLFGHTNDAIILLNTEIQKMCADASVPYIDLYPLMLNENGVLKEQYTNDNLHLMGNAYEVWKEAITPYMEE